MENAFAFVYQIFRKQSFKKLVAFVCVFVLVIINKQCIRQNTAAFLLDEMKNNNSNNNNPQRW